MSGTLERGLNDMEVRVRDWLQAASHLSDQVAGLDVTRRQQLQPFPGVFSKTEIDSYLHRTKEAVEHPLKERARQLVESMGLRSTRFPDEYLLDLDQLRELSDAFGTVRQSLPDVADRLIEKGWLLSALREGGLSGAINYLKKLHDHQSTFRKLNDTPPLAPLRQQLLDDCLPNASNLSELRPLLEGVSRVLGYRVGINTVLPFTRLKTRIDSLVTLLNSLQDLFGIAREEIDREVGGKGLEAAHEALIAFQRRCEDEKRQLRAEIETYEQLLEEEAVGSTTLQSLRQRARTLRKKCERKLGSGGMDLVRYLLDEGEYPENLSPQTLRRTIDFLKPRFKSTLL